MASPTLAFPGFAAGVSTTSNQTVANSAVWQYWNCDVESLIAVSCSDVWTTWNVDYPAQTVVFTVDTADAWNAWNNSWIPCMQIGGLAGGATPDQIRVAQERGEATRIARELASSKARSLLLENLDPDQRTSFERGSTFEVLSRDGKRIYQVRYGTAGNVFLMKNGRPVKRFCIHPADSNIPTEDVMLVQKLMIEGAEDEFVRIANKTDVAA